MPCPKGCCASYRQHLLSIGFSATGTPSRRPEAIRNLETEKRWTVDHAAYRRLVKNGLQPTTLDGAAELERRATSEVEVEHGLGAPKELADLT